MFVVMTFSCEGGWLGVQFELFERHRTGRIATVAIKPSLHLLENGLGRRNIFVGKRIPNLARGNHSFTNRQSQQRFQQLFIHHSDPQSHMILL